MSPSSTHDEDMEPPPTSTPLPQPEDSDMLDGSQPKDRAMLMTIKNVMSAMVGYGLKWDKLDTPLTVQQAADLYCVAIVMCRTPVNGDWIPQAHGCFFQPESPANRVAHFNKAKEHAPNLQLDLSRAYQNEYFGDIQTAEYLMRPYRRVAEVVQVYRTLNNERAARETVQNAWRTPYQTENPLFLSQLLIDMKAPMPKLDYCNTVSIVQSSGAGKSRMIDETAQFIFTLPFNLRSEKESAGLAYPLPDKDIRDHLCVVLTEEELRIRYHCFFGCLFQRVAEVVKELELVSDNPSAAKDLAAAWRDHLLEEGARDALYKEVVGLARAAEVKSWTERSLVKQGKRERSNSGFMKATSKIAQGNLDVLVSALDKLVSDGPSHIKILLYFDEAHHLTKPDGVGGSTKTLYQVLLSVLNDYISHPLFVVFLSTTSHLATLAPPRAQANSDRATQSIAHHAPITETPFDCAPNIQVLQGMHTCKQVASVWFMARFGRPLFWTWIVHIDEESSEATAQVDSFMILIRSKLIGKDCGLAYKDSLLLGRLAAIDVRLCLDYEPQVSENRGVKAQANLVASHMRMMYSVPAHREYFRSGYSSEPILAEAAAQQLHHWREEGQPPPLLRILKDNMDDNLLDRGERGEVVARMLVTEAYDQAVFSASDASQPGSIFSQGCSVVNWIEKLFAKNHAKAILDSFPDNCGGETLREVFENAWLRFTHFSKAADDSVLNPHAMFAGFARGMAFTCWNSQKTVDFILPVLLNKDKPIGPSVMTGILVQVKRRTQRGNYPIDAELLNFFDPNTDPSPPPKDNRPYITLIMQLGVQQELPSYAEIPTRSANAKKKAQHTLPDIPKQSQDLSNVIVSSEKSKRHHPDLHPRYKIDAIGCSDKIYEVIREQDILMYQELLRLNDFLYEHPRPKTIPEVLRQKPFFAFGVASFSWCKTDVLNKLEGAGGDAKAGK